MLSITYGDLWLPPVVQRCPGSCSCSWDNRTRYPNFLVGILFYFGTMICIFILPFGTTKGKHIVPWRMLSGTWNHFLGCIYSHAADSDFGFLHEGLDLSLHYLTISGCRFSTWNHAFMVLCPHTSVSLLHSIRWSWSPHVDKICLHGSWAWVV